MGISVGQRLKKLVDAVGGITELTKDTDMKIGTLSGIMKRDGKPSFDVCASIFSKYSALSERWFMLNEGKMWKDQESKESLMVAEEPTNYYARLKRNVVSADGNIESMKLEYLVDLIKSKDAALDAQRLTIQTLREQVEILKKTA